MVEKTKCPRRVVLQKSVGFFAENLSKSDDTFGTKIAQELPEIPNIRTADVVKKQNKCSTQQ